jgi:sigma-E factor negative regulatory protein RseA
MERVSALVDGELEDGEIAREVGLIEDNPGHRAAWDTYLLIGDVLRGQDTLTVGLSAKVGRQLAAEPTVLAPRPARVRQLVRKAAMPLAASVVGVAAVAWIALYNNPFAPQSTLVAETERPAEQVTATVTGESVGPTMNEYLMAHQQFSPSTAMQGVGSYVRTVSVREADYRP